MTFYQVAFLFFTYSFLGWVGEVVFTAAVRRKYQDRGVLSGPLCILYGIGALVITFALRDIRDGWFFLFVFSAVYATVIEWIGGHILEYTSHTRWWDYSTQPFNLDGYICLGASVTWGVLGVIMLKWGNPLLLALYSLVPQGVWAVVLWAALILLGIDLIGTLLAMAGLRYRWPAAEAIENRLANLTVRGGMWILDRVERRMAKTHPALTFIRPKRAQTGTFAAGCSPYKIVLLFFIGAFLGRHHRDDLLPRCGRRVDEPFQRCVGAFLHRMGPCHRTGHPAALPLQGQARQLAFCDRHTAGRCV